MVEKALESIAERCNSSVLNIERLGVINHWLIQCDKNRKGKTKTPRVANQNKSYNLLFYVSLNSILFMKLQLD